MNETLITILVIYAIYGILAAIVGLCFTVNGGVLLYDEHPLYFSPVSLCERTDLNIFGAVIMSIIHFILNPLYCALVTVFYIIAIIFELVYLIMHV